MSSEVDTSAVGVERARARAAGKTLSFSAVQSDMFTFDYGTTRYDLVLFMYMGPVGKTLMAICKKLTKHSPKMWGPSIIGYGSYRYTSESGRSGEMPLAAFAIRGRHLVVYLDAEDAEQRALLSRLGKHQMGKSCLYFKRLGDIDQSVLEQLVIGSIARVNRKPG